MKIVNYDELTKEYFESYEVEDLEIVDKIISEIRQEGDVALRKYMTRYDNLDCESYELSTEDISEAYRRLPQDTIETIKTAANNIRTFAGLQFSMFRDIEDNSNGYIYGHRIIALDRVGCYVPGGRYPLPSTALMTVIPAKIAGVREIIVCSPKITDETIVAANVGGADRIFNLGGAQAIAALAYGTQSVPKVDKIVGPGNKYVAAAKKRVYGAVGIDFIAGPSEVLIFADNSAKPDLIAADLLAQAEHDPLARSDLVTTSRDLANQVLIEVNSQLQSLQTKDIATPAIKSGKIIIVPNLTTGIAIINKRAPEHLELQLTDNDKVISDLTSYGSLFIGKYSAEVFGDYCSGPNHTLPTNRVARYTGGLSVKDFIKIVTYQKLSPSSMSSLIDTSAKLAAIEGLHGHQRAAELRRNFIEND